MRYLASIILIGALLSCNAQQDSIRSNYHWYFSVGSAWNAEYAAGVTKTFCHEYYIKTFPSPEIGFGFSYRCKQIPLRGVVQSSFTRSTITYNHFYCTSASIPPITREVDNGSVTKYFNHSKIGALYSLMNIVDIGVMFRLDISYNQPEVSDTVGIVRLGFLESGKLIGHNVVVPLVGIVFVKDFEEERVSLTYQFAHGLTRSALSQKLNKQNFNRYSHNVGILFWIH